MVDFGSYGLLLNVYGFSWIQALGGNEFTVGNPDLGARTL